MKYDIESIKRRKEINNRIKKIIFILIDKNSLDGKINI